MKPFYIILLTIMVFNAHAQNKELPYEFPVKPGTPEWKFSSPEIMYKTCEIPKDELSTIGTRALVITCINYPLFGLMNAFNSPQAGFEAVKQKFNGLNELLGRKDAGTALFSLPVNGSWPTSKIMDAS